MSRTGRLGRLLEERGDRVGAATCYRWAARLRPLDAATHPDLAQMLGGLGEVTEAIRHYKYALALATDDAGTPIDLGDVLLQGGAVGDPDQAEAHSNLREALRWMRRLLDEAVAACERALALTPEPAEAHNSLGNALREEGRPRE